MDYEYMVKSFPTGHEDSREETSHELNKLATMGWDPHLMTTGTDGVTVILFRRPRRG